MAKAKRTAAQKRATKKLVALNKRKRKGTAPKRKAAKRSSPKLRKRQKINENRQLQIVEREVIV